MNAHFDVLVIGTGSAGTTIAKRCAKAGLDTAIVDCRPYGGTCAIRGCDPKKILVDGARYMDMNDRLTNLLSKKLSIGWKDLMAFKRSFTDPYPEKREKSYSDAGITMFKGVAVFDSKNSVAIGEESYSADKIAITTGAKPMDLNIEGEHHLIHSDDFLELEGLPEEIIFVGGGFISFEFAHIASRFGSKVKILNDDDRPLKMHDKDMVSMLINYSKRLGIDVILNSPAESIEEKNGRFILGAGGTEFSSKLVVHGAGRVANIDQLGLENANIEGGKDGVAVNEYMQSITNENIYCAGDASAGSPLLTPVCVEEAKIAARNIIEGNTIKRKFEIIPYTLYTIPPMASVGISEEMAEEKGLDYRKKSSDTSGWYNLKKVGYKGTGFKVLIDNGSNRILGAHLISPDAENIINIFSMAMYASFTVDEVKDMILTYPSITSDIKYMI